ncbi:ABC transporter substrate-binding protein [Streptomyces meridianus]|uniref:ABC transporter substrate-binding protein n=1 Tax=Streptomyces meridianus TaxID=2938945 RepID=A0ABT0X3P5_9ACTN|nr:ABC transporter substrate-binding protein [Streptomyces meridianus]MCM2576930.1 ABC transporter substrate-binding protein [Streptomyces meridianus]
MTDGSWVRQRPLWARWPWNAVFGASLIALAGGLLWWLFSTSCADGVRRVGADGQCVGVTDGEYHFTQNLGKISELILKENRSVEQEEAKHGTAYVSVVYLMPMMPDEKDSNTVDSLRHELQGAYAAQYDANHHFGNGDVPRIKLLLGNSGSSTEQRSAALDEIRKRTEADRIVAVAGLGTSTNATKEMVGTITKPAADGGLGLGAVGAVLTADTFDEVEGLVRVAPTNSDEAAAAAAFLQSKEYADKRVLVVQDSKPDDQYTRTLSQAFLKALPKKRRFARVEQYDSSQAGSATTFKALMANLCTYKPDVVYFAGRGVDLPKFLAPLRTRICNDRPLTVFAGDDVSQSPQARGFDEILETLRDGNVELLYTGLAHPGAWELAENAYPTDGAFGEKGSYRKFFRNDRLDDGQAIMGHDALTTAVSAIRLEGGTAADQKVNGSMMIQRWKSLHGVHAVAGASGLISLQNDGSPERKAVPVIEIGSDGIVRTVAVSANGGDPLTRKDLAG